DGCPPLSTGLETRRYEGIHWRSWSWVARDGDGRRSPAADTKSAMGAPVPPEMEYTQTPTDDAPEAPGLVGGLARARRAEVSSSSSSPSTRITPSWRRAAEITASEPARCP